MLCKQTVIFVVCRQTFLTMYEQFLMCFPKENYLLDTLQYIVMSADDILGVNTPEVGRQGGTDVGKGGREGGKGGRQIARRQGG